jgi:type IV pilus assembly protein PilB
MVSDDFRHRESSLGRRGRDVTLTEKLRVPRELESRFLYGDVDGSLADDEPAIHAVDEIFDSAIRARASDIHIEPLGDGGRVRERIDGMLRESRHVSARLLPRVLSRIKLLAGMDIADRRLPQDGRYAVERPGAWIDARVSSIPTIAGEKLAVRLLDARAQIPSLEALGMTPAMAARYRSLVHALAGFVVVCGPTGSGKTTTLYASMSERNVAGQQLCSIEDPVEIRLLGTAQVQVNLRAGLTFAAGLRSFLRQDPNVIMIGEVQDNQTIVLGGLMRDTSNETISRIPWISDIPIIGKLFQNKQTGHERDEIVFLITPHVIYPGGTPPVK